jgi:hypothetical protein
VRHVARALASKSGDRATMWRGVDPGLEKFKNARREAVRWSYCFVNHQKCAAPKKKKEVVSASTTAMWELCVVWYSCRCAVCGQGNSA